MPCPPRYRSFSNLFVFILIFLPKPPFSAFQTIIQQPPKVRPDPVQVELSKRLDSIERRLDRIETHQRYANAGLRQDNAGLRQDMRQDIAEVHRRLDALNGRIYWVIGTQIALMGLLFAALKLT